MYSLPHQMEPLRPTHSAALIALAQRVITADARLRSIVRPEAKAAAAEMVLAMNCHYSSLIEGVMIPPADIERALKKDFSQDPKQAELQHLAAAHIRTARMMVDQVKGGRSPVQMDFICECHRVFYDGIPTSLKVLDDGTLIEPGAFRKRDVIVGQHVPPAWESIPEFMARFGVAYAAPHVPKSNRLIDIAAAHHRLAWIHPFVDGNGRVSRIVADAMLIDAGVNVDGLWSLSRGFAKGLVVEGGKSITYVSRLHNADRPRMGDYDGRGNLSTKTLAEFCEYVLRTAIDQIGFMTSVFECDDVSLHAGLPAFFS